MSINSTQAGYIGIFTLDNSEIRCTSASLTQSQNVEYYDHTIGLRDSIETDLLSTKQDVGNINYQKYLWRPGVISINGSISFPMTTDIFNEVFEKARTGDSFNAALSYGCDLKREIYNCKLQTLTVNISAGDIMQGDISFVGTDLKESGTISRGSNYRSSQKFITWDVVDIDIDTSFNDPVESFSFTVNNECIPIYTSSSLYPYTIRIGLQDLNGDIGFYHKGADLINLDELSDDEAYSIDITAYNVKKTLNVIYTPIERSAGPGVLIYNLPFVGVGKAMGAY